MVNDLIISTNTLDKKTSERYMDRSRRGVSSTDRSATGLSKKSKKKKKSRASSDVIAADTTLAQIFGRPPKKTLPTKKLASATPQKKTLPSPLPPTRPSLKPLPSQQAQKSNPFASYNPSQPSSDNYQEKQDLPLAKPLESDPSLPRRNLFAPNHDELRPETLHDYENPISSHIQNLIDQTRYSDRFLKTHVPGLDALLVEGIPKGASVIICGGTGSGKTILNLQIMAMACRTGKKCLYLTLEESEARLIDHMADFGWDAKKYISEGKLRFLRLNPFDIMRSVDALLAKEKGELLIDIKPVILPKDFVPDMIFVDSLTAISAAFVGRRDTYRIYIEKLFRYFEELKATTFLITETEQIPTQYSPTGTEEFLADGVIILYSIQRHNVHERAIEVLKMRGLAHQQKIVSMRIIKGIGIKIFPEKEVPITL
jgi:circadian clock protein KaiC